MRDPRPTLIFFRLAMSFVLIVSGLALSIAVFTLNNLAFHRELILVIGAVSMDLSGLGFYLSALDPSLWEPRWPPEAERKHSDERDDEP